MPETADMADMRSPYRLEGCTKQYRQKIASAYTRYTAYSKISDRTYRADTRIQSIHERH